LSAQQQIYRTSPERMGRMMAIMVGICVVGGAIFFGMWDYWISMPAPVVAGSAGDAVPAPPPPAASGTEIRVDLDFVESDDFLTLGFNGLPGEEGANPTVMASVGDRILFDVNNAGVSFHSFGVTADAEGYAGVIPGTEVASPADPLRPGEGGLAEFVPAEEGTYYYICTVPGHREQGMVGEIIVGPREEAAPAPPREAMSHEFDLDFVESDDFLTLGFNGLPGEEGANPEIRVRSGDTITVRSTNTGVSFHSFGVVTDPEDFNSVVWDSAIASATAPLRGGESGEVTFVAGAPGLYHYICTVPGHSLQGMQGTFVVE